MKAILLTALLAVPAFAADPLKPQGPEAPAPSDDAASLARLNPELLAQVLQKREETRQAEIRAHQEQMNPPRRSENVLVPAFLFVFLAVVLLGRLWAGMRWDRTRHETIRAMVEKGVPVPRQLLELPSRATADLRRGIVLIALGLSGSLCLTLIPHGTGLWALGSIPALIGIGYLIAWRVTLAAAAKAAPADEAP